MDVRGILNSTAFFNVVLDAEQLDALATGTRVVTFAKRDVLLRERELGQSMFAIVEGKVGISRHTPEGDRAVATLGPGDVVGEMSLFTGERRSATATALGKVVALEVGKEALQPILAAAPKLVDRFAALVEQRHAELANRSQSARAALSLGIGRSEIAARMFAFYRS
ncbi:MAG: cyclic nucleotide-binding domain-containing protein [Rhizobiales bacterium]|nr:cyclic nucleotide-binding domain-containing protein [Hyphomicrobiales bacterium]